MVKGLNVRSKTYLRCKPGVQSLKGCSGAEVKPLSEPGQLEPRKRTAQGNFISGLKTKSIS